MRGENGTDATLAHLTWAATWRAPAWGVPRRGDRSVADAVARYLTVEEHLDPIHVHPFDDGNARAARQGLAGWLRLHDLPVPPFAAAIAEVVSLGIHDSWYQVVPPVVTWLLERNGVEVPDDLHDRLAAACELSFTSWTTPGATGIRKVAETMAWDALEAVAAARWPS